MTDYDINDAHVPIYQRIGEELFGALPEGEWESVKVVCQMIWFTAAFEGSYTRPDGTTTEFHVPRTLWQHFTDLRDATYSAGKGAWYVAVFEMNSEGDVEVKFDYDTKPDLMGADDAAFLEDLGKYPRDPDVMPPWHPRP